MTIESSQNRRRGGFTLIELLTVIAIIGILSAILIPVVGRVRDSSRKAVSASNLRQWGTALHLYLDDSLGLIPTRGPQESPTWAQIQPLPPQFAHLDNQGRATAWYNVLPPYVGEKPLHEMNASERTRTGSPMLMEQSMHVDPTADYSEIMEQISNRPLFSYTMNSQLTALMGTVGSTGDHAMRLPYSAITFPTGTPFLFETRVGSKDGHSTIQGANQYARAYGRNRHVSYRGGRVQMLFFDGSVRGFPSDYVFNQDYDNRAANSPATPDIHWFIEP